MALDIVLSYDFLSPRSEIYLRYTYTMSLWIDMDQF